MFALRIRAKPTGNICASEQNTLFSKLIMLLLVGSNPVLVLANLCLGMPGQCQLAQPKSVPGTVLRVQQGEQSDSSLFMVIWHCLIYNTMGLCTGLSDRMCQFSAFCHRICVVCYTSRHFCLSWFCPGAIESPPGPGHAPPGCCKINPVLFRTRTLPQNAIKW